MADNTARVREWRQQRKEHGLVAVTLWLEEETKLRIEDMASQQRRTLSELAQELFAAYRTPEPVTATVPDIAQLQQLIDERVAQGLSGLAAPVTVAVPDTAQLQELVQELIDQTLARRLPQETPVTATVAVIAQQLPAVQAAMEQPAETRPATGYGKLKPAIQAAIPSLGRFTAAEMARVINRNTKSVCKPLKELVQSGELQREGQHYFSTKGQPQA